MSTLYSTYRNKTGGELKIYQLGDDHYRYESRAGYGEGSRKVLQLLFIDVLHKLKRVQGRSIED